MRRRLSVSKTRNVKMKIESESKLYWHYEISVFEIPRELTVFLSFLKLLHYYYYYYYYHYMLLILLVFIFIIILFLRF